MSNDERYETNLKWWQERAALHPGTPLYADCIEQLKAGGTALKPIELEEMGEVAGKRLLHLQCHIGTDTLSWARLGAEVHGVDFSEEALRQAERLTEELGLSATWEHGNVTALGERWRDEFDIVFTSYGAITGLHDLDNWAATIAAALKPGGTFYMVDGHPMLFALADMDAELPLRLHYPYFHQHEPNAFEGTGSYADEKLETTSNKTWDWAWSISEVLTPLLKQGLVLELFGEHRELPWKPLPCCEPSGTNDLYRLPESIRGQCPMLFSVRFRKPDTAA
jgi:2-polyprenyl-3-methyl-5-hydroxy-6-metoxy-1,4-benzoquinol methylase